MKLYHGVILAVVQSATEFIPISSSGHLVIASRLLGLGDVPILFDLVLHLGTVAATVFVFRGELRDMAAGVFLHRARVDAGGGTIETARGSAKLLAYIALSVAVTGAIGVSFHDAIGSFFSERAGEVPLLIVCTGAILLATAFAKAGEREIGDLGLPFPVVVGLAQGVAILPGISRSGSTIAAGLFMGASRQFAGLYSFLLSIPSVLGAALAELAFEGWGKGLEIDPAIYFAAFAISCAAGYGALKLLLGFLKKGRIYVFSFYCIAGGAVWYVLMRANLV